MNVTVLGTGDAVGMPVPLCSCAYCDASQQRFRPALLVEHGETTVVFDAGPDLPTQLDAAGVTTPDAVFLTHHHYDHMGGIWELYHAHLPLSDHVLNPEVYSDGQLPPRTTVPVYATEAAATRLEDTHPGFTDLLAADRLTPGDEVQVGELSVTPFPVDHARPAFDTQGFRVETGAASVVYAPDLCDWLPDRDGGTLYQDSDLLVGEGAGLFTADPHGPGRVLAEALASADADQTILVNISEHLHRQHTDVLAAEATDYGYELGYDMMELAV